MMDFLIPIGIGVFLFLAGGVAGYSLGFGRGYDKKTREYMQAAAEFQRRPAEASPLDEQVRGEDSTVVRRTQHNSRVSSAHISQPRSHWR